MKSLPLVNLSLLRPFLSALCDRGLDPEPVLESVGLTENAIARDDETVHVMVVHQFLENCAELVGDPTFCASVGTRLDPTGWPMIESALSTGCSLADFLAIYISGANEVATSVTAYLDVRGDRAVFGETRLFRPTILPAQNDGFMMGLTFSILRRALGNHLNPAGTTLVLCDPNVLPTDFAEFSLLKGDDMGFRIEFPSAWLVYTIHEHATPETFGKIDRKKEVGQFLLDVRGLISRHFREGGLKADDVASLVSMTRSKLARRLAREGTSISKEIRSARLALARERLRSTDDPVDAIAAALGYADPANFSRAFRNVEGMSPRAYRAKIEAGEL
ncbi:MAG: helix-turn-helix domain-containing protein [Pseudomonadota bacterium]